MIMAVKMIGKREAALLISRMVQLQEYRKEGEQWEMKTWGQVEWQGK